MVREVKSDVKSKNLAKDRSENNTLNSPHKTSNAKITIKKIKMANISSITLIEPSKDCSDSWPETFMLKAIHTGANKMTSNATTIEFYDTVRDGVKKYHTAVLKAIEIDKRKIPLPPKVRLNKDNICVPQNALLNKFRKDNPYNPCKKITTK